MSGKVRPFGSHRTPPRSRPAHCATRADWSRAFADAAGVHEVSHLQLNYDRNIKPAVRYPPGHREKSRARILRAAAELFRREGIAATGVDRVMARAGLTAGAFYAHFPSKNALVTQAVEAGAIASQERWFGRFADLRGRAWAEALLETYLSGEHRDDRTSGCILPSLGGEIGRCRRPSRLRFERRVRAMLDVIEARTHDELSADRGAIVAALAACVGGLLLSRALVTPALSREILEGARLGAKRLLGLEHEPGRRARRRPVGGKRGRRPRTKVERIA
jgi:TetR/AcrR family transcriptional repressor of nem operon